MGEDVGDYSKGVDGSRLLGGLLVGRENGIDGLTLSLALGAKPFSGSLSPGIETGSQQAVLGDVVPEHSDQARRSLFSCY